MSTAILLQGLGPIIAALIRSGVSVVQIINSAGPHVPPAKWAEIQDGLKAAKEKWDRA